MTTDTPSDLVKRLRDEIGAWVLPLNTRGHDLILEAADRIEELEKMLATESEVTLKFSQAIDRLERELAEVRSNLAVAEYVLDSHRLTNPE